MNKTSLRPSTIQRKKKGANENSYSIANIEKYQQRKNKTTLSEKAIPAIIIIIIKKKNKGLVASNDIQPGSGTSLFSKKKNE